MYHRLRREIESHQRHESREIRIYRKRYDREVRKYRKISSKTLLIQAVENADIVYCGDYHTLRQAQRLPIKILAPLVDQGRQVTLALEMVPKSMESVSNDFVRKRIDEKRFLKKIRYEERWGFSWNNYKQLFEFAQAHNVRVIGLSSDINDRLPLEARDDLAADFVVEATISQPENIVFAFFGDLHIAEQHIPSRVKMRLDRYGLKRSTLSIFQNSEPIYWELARKNLEASVDVVEISKNKFCVLNAPPWIKLQSYRSWLEDQTNLLDEGETYSDYYHQVLDLAVRISQVLHLMPKELDHFSVLTAHDTHMISLLDKYEGRKNLLQSEIVENRSCFFADRSILYLNDLSENRAAEKAGQLIAVKIDEKDLATWEYWRAKDGRELFYRLLLWEAIGFLSSKMVNLKRKCDHYRDFQKKLLFWSGAKLDDDEKDEKRMLKEIIQHRSYELRRLKTGKTRGVPKKLFKLAPRYFFLAASSIGKILANRMYIAFVKKEIELSLLQLLFSPIPKSENAEGRYWEILAQIRQHVLKAHESKEDRF